MRVLHDNFGNTATLTDVIVLPYKGASERKNGVRLTLTADYDNDFVYHVAVYETEQDALNRLKKISCDTWK
jgi:hypothetical protein